ncbi:MAG: hypothetical protein WBM44_10305, partial [Waterburya sp.]
FLTTDEGSHVEIPRFLRKASARLTRLQHRKDKLPGGHKDQQKPAPRGKEARSLCDSMRVE